MRVSLLVADGVSLKSVEEICDALHKEGVHPQIIAAHMGTVKTEEGEDLLVDGSLAANLSVLFDSVIVPEGAQSIQTLLTDGDAKYHLRQAYRHLKAIGLPGDAREMLQAASLPDDMDDGRPAHPEGYQGADEALHHGDEAAPHLGPGTQGAGLRRLTGTFL